MPNIFASGVTYRDARGHVGRVKFFINQGGVGTIGDSSSLSTAVLNALNAITNAVPIGYFGLGNTAGNQVLNPDQYGANAVYQNIEDKALLIFLMANNTLSRLSIPAPIGSGGSNIFMPDGETVNLAAAGITALTGALTAVGAHLESPSTKNGSLYNILVAGMRVRRKWQRKTTLWTLTPSETGPEE